jgi:hypothetical protein
LNTTLINDSAAPYLVITDSVPVIQKTSDALDLVAACGEQGTNLLLLKAENLSPAFFDLSSGLAGDILLKFTNYCIKVALVIPRDLPVSERFAEFASETRFNREFRIFHQEDSALNWLQKR